MGLRDRFFTPRTARAIMSWRILVGVGAGLALRVAGLPLGVAIGVGAGVAMIETLGLEALDRAVAETHTA